MIRPDRKEELQKYITGIVTRCKQKLIAINAGLVAGSHGKKGLARFPFRIRS